MAPPLHADETPIDEALARRLIVEQFPHWSGLPLRSAGHGTDNVMFRLGDDFVLRMPRTPGTAADVAKEQAWLPRLAPYLPCEVPTPVALGSPQDDYPHPWSVYRWIDGEVAQPATIGDPARFGADLAAFVAALHRVETGDTVRGGALAWYRGEPLASMADTVAETLRACRALEGLDLDLDAVERLWRRCAAVPQAPRPDVWTHADLRLDNLLVRDGRLAAVIDFGALALGDPTAVHAAAWEWPAAARDAYREALALDEATWLLASGWKAALSLLGIPYYWQTWPEFAAGGVDTLRLLLDELGA